MSTPADAARAARPAEDFGRRRITLTGRGRTFIAVGVIATLAGLTLGVTDLVRVGFLLLALPVPAWWAVQRARSGLNIEHALRPARVPVGERAEVHLMLGNPNAFGTGPLRIAETVPGDRPLRFSVAGVRGRQRRTVAYPLPTNRRGRFVVGPTDVTASDPFGLVTADNRSGSTAEIIVQPRRDILAPLTLPMAWRDGGTHSSHSVGSGGSDDASVREYRDGDDLRKIHWRSTARSGTMMVRQEERPWHGQSMVLLDSRTGAFPPADAEAFEWAVSAAASIAAHLVDRGRRVCLVNGSGRMAADDTQAMLDLLAVTGPAMRVDVSPLAEALNGMGRDASVFAVLAGHEPRMLSELAARPRLPGSAVALLLKPWTFSAGGSDRDLSEPTTDGSAHLPHLAPDDRRTAAAEADWQASADALRVAGWRVVAADADSDLPTLWPSLLSATGSRR